MIQNLEISGVHMNVDENLHKYIVRKIGKLDRYLRRSIRENARLEVRLKETKIDGKKECCCEVTLHVPGNSIVVAETTINMYAAVDIVQSKLKQQIIKARERHHDAREKRRLFERFMRSSA